MRNLTEFKALLGTKKECVLVMHTRPDADALGSSLGLAGYLKKKGHSVTVISPSNYPDFLKWMNGNDEVIIYDNGNQKRSVNALKQADLIFCLDFSSLNRIDELGEAIAGAKAVKVLIDHHLDPENFAQFNFWSTESAATAQIVHDLIVELGDGSLIDRSIGESLYAGLMTDTGSFRHPSTSAAVFETAAHLVKCGVDVNKVSRMVYDSNTIDRLRLIGHALSAKMTVLPEYKTVYFALNVTDLNNYNYQSGDSEGLVNYGLSIKNINLAATIIEGEDGIKMSFRSVGDFSVNEFAKKHFSGGGHKNAAGGRSSESMEKTINKFETLLSEYKDQIIKQC